MLLKVAAALGLLTTYAITHVAAGVVPITSQDDSEIVLSAGSALPCDLAIQASQPVKLSDLSQSAAVEGIHQNTRVYYQTSDGAIWEAAGVGLPNPSYSKKIILPAGKARVYSPIAVTAAYDFRVVRNTFLFPSTNMIDLLITDAVLSDSCFVDLSLLYSIGWYSWRVGISQ